MILICLKIGRHFRLDRETKFVVGRNKDENEMIKAIALPGDILLEARDDVGPVSILRRKKYKRVLRICILCNSKILRCFKRASRNCDNKKW